METVIVKASTEYSVYIGSGITGEIAGLISEKQNPKKIMVVSDDMVAGLHLNSLKTMLENSGFETHGFVFPRGEENKNMMTVSAILEKMAELKFCRNDMIIAFGGGISGDIGGFAASVYLRGINFIQIPTTLLSCVDSSVGGKTGVNLSAGKNLAGSFRQPLFTLIDVDYLKTLPEKEFANGMAEVIKYGIIGGNRITELLENADSIKETAENSILLKKIIAECVKIKAGFAERDEFDLGERHLLNFGHTVGHAIEKVSDYSVSHGFGVGIGMAVMIRGCEKMQICKSGTYGRFEKIMKKYSLPLYYDCSDGELLQEAVLHDKKSTGDGIELVIPEEMGKCRIEKASFSFVNKLLETGMEEF